MIFHTYLNILRIFNKLLQAPHIPEEDSYFITSESIQLNMEDPPEEYESFEDEYFSHSLARVKHYLQ